jgi:hypothetical protein
VCRLSKPAVGSRVVPGLNERGRPVSLEHWPGLNERGGVAGLLEHGPGEVLAMLALIACLEGLGCHFCALRGSGNGSHATAWL